MSRTKKIDRDQILDAAEQVVYENGVQSLTLDTVAARAGISKGGLTYTFASKEMLLTDLLDRQITRIRLRHKDRALAHQGVEYPGLHDFLERSRLGKTSARKKMAPILAALAYSPHSLKSSRAFYEEMLAKLPPDSASGRRARLVFMGLQGMFFLQGLGVLRLNNKTQNALLDDLLALLTGTLT